MPENVNEVECIRRAEPATPKQIVARDEGRRTQCTTSGQTSRGAGQRERIFLGKVDLHHDLTAVDGNTVRC